jgi:hypothetical protein
MKTKDKEIQQLIPELYRARNNSPHAPVSEAELDRAYSSPHPTAAKFLAYRSDINGTADPGSLEEYQLDYEEDHGCLLKTCLPAWHPIACA